MTAPAEHTPWAATADGADNWKVVETVHGASICRGLTVAVADLIVRDHNAHPQHVALIKTLLEALEPFSKAASEFDGQHDCFDSDIVLGGFTNPVTLGDLKRAAAALVKVGPRP